MTNAEMLTLIMGRVKRSSIQMRAIVLNEMNEKIRQLEQSDVLPWFLQDIWTGETIAHQDYISVASDFLREDDEGIGEIRDTTIIPIAWFKFPKIIYGKLREDTANSEEQVPGKYAVYGEKVYFGPVPDQVYSFRIPYYKRTSPVIDNTSAITNKWLLEFFNFITLETINIVARTHTRGNPLVLPISSELSDARQRFNRAVEARIHAQQEYLLDDEEN